MFPFFFGGKMEKDYLKTIEEVTTAILKKRKYSIKTVNPNLNKELKKFIDSVIRALFPFVRDIDEGNCPKTKEASEYIRRCSFFSDTFLSLSNVLVYLGKERVEAFSLSKDFISRLVNIFEILECDAEAFLDEDPACNSIDEVVLCYPGFRAILIYRLAHELYKMNIDLLPRLLTEYAHRHTGIDIHPGAKIGKSFFIDHGTGVVIGETCVIGDNVTIYQNVTLGARNLKNIDKKSSSKKIKRHPSIEDGCIIYAGATILGGDTTIGKNSTIGANVWLVHSVPANSIVKKSDART